MELVEYLKRAVEDRASDLFIVAGGVVSEKAEGPPPSNRNGEGISAGDRAADFRYL